VGFFFSRHFDKRKRLSAMESELSKTADIVFTTSKYLYNLRKLQNTNTHYLPSAIDLKIFRKALSTDFKVAPELKTIPKPILGFVGGMVNSKMNWQWIKEVALSHPQWNFVFVGPCIDYPPSYITDQKNIIFLGAKAQETIPSYIKGFDVCLIPYQGEDFLKAAQPTKAFEYLAVGKPVVTSWISEFEDHRAIIRLSHGVKDFIRNIEAALEAGKDDKMVKLYVQTAQGWTWEDRVEKTSALIRNFLSGY
jgi:glycosyltransferase involved in cell wall biosynthesis